MATNLTGIPRLFQGDDIAALNQELLEKYQNLMSMDIEGMEVTDPTNSDLTPVIPPLDPDSQEYKDIANSWSNRLGAGFDSMYSMFNEGLGLLADQFGADEAAVSFREDAAQNLRDRANRPQPEITGSITDTASKISEDISDDQWYDAVNKAATGIKALASEAVPSLAPAVGGLAAARALTPFLLSIPIVGVPAAVTANIILTFGSGYLMMSGEAYKRAKDLGADEPAANIAGVVGGGVGGLLDRFFAGTLLDGLVKTVGKKEVKRRFAEETSEEAAEEIVEKGLKAASIESLRSGLKQAGKIGGIGAITEGAQGATTELTSHIAAGKLPEIAEFSKKIIDEAALGLVGGGVPGLVIGSLTPIARREAKLKAEELKRNEEELKKAASQEFEDGRVINKATDLESSEATEAPSISSGTFADKLVRRAVSFLKESASKNPLADKLFNQLSNYFNTVSVNAGIGLKESADIWRTAVEEQSKVVKLPFTKSIEKNINEGVAKVLRGFSLDLKKYKGDKGAKQLQIIKNLTKDFDTDQNGTPIEGTAGKLRQLLNDERQKLVDAGVPVKFHVDYLTQSYKIPMTGFGRSRAKKAFVTILKNNKAINSKVRRALAVKAEEIVENIISNNGTYSPDSDINLFKDFKTGETLPVTQKGFELERTIPPEVVQQLDEAGLVNNDAQGIINKYIINAARRKEIQRLYNNFNDKADKLGLTREEIKRTQQIFQALQNKFNRIDGMPRKILEFLVTAGYLTTLPFAGIISLSEPVLVLSRVSPKNAIWGALKAGRVSLDKAIRSVFPKHHVSDLENSFNLLQQTADLALTDAVRDIGDVTINKKITDAFFKITFLSQVTQFSRQMASVAVSQQLQEDILLVADEVKTGNPTSKGNKARMRLNEQGLRNLFSGRKGKIKEPKPPKGKKGRKPTKRAQDKYESELALIEEERKGQEELPNVEQEAIAWAESNITEEQAMSQFKLLGVPVTDELVIQKFKDKGEPPLIIKKALSKTIDEIIMSPNVVNRPLWMSDPRLVLIAQLKGFMMVFGNTIAPKIYKDVIKPLSPVHRNRQGGIEARMPNFEGTFRYGLTFGLLLSAMYGTQIIKNAIRYEDEEDSPLADLEGWELMSKLLQQSNVLGYGNILIDMAQSDKYGQDPILTAAGPVAGKLSSFWKSFSALSDKRPRSLANWLAKNTPFTGALGKKRREDIPIVGTKAWEELLEDLLD